MVIPNMTLTEIKKLNRNEYYEMLEANKIIVKEEEERQERERKEMENNY